MSDRTDSRTRFIGVMAALITIGIWSSFIVVSRAALLPGQQVTPTPFDIAFLRFLGAGILMFPAGIWMVRQQRKHNPEAEHWLWLSPLSWRLTALIGCFGGIFYASAAYSGLHFAPASHASVLMPGTLPLFTAVFAALFLREQLTQTRIFGLTMIFIGDLLVGGNSLLGIFNDNQIWRGDLLFLTGAATWAIYTIVARHHALDPGKATAAISVFTALTFLPVYALLATHGFVESRLSLLPWSTWLYQAFFQGGLAVVVSGYTFIVMIRHFGPVRSTMMTALVPGISALGAFVVLGESLRWNLISGLLMVTAGILLGAYQRLPARLLQNQP